MALKYFFATFIISSALHATCIQDKTEITVEFPFVDKLSSFQKHKCDQLKSLIDMPWFFTGNSEVNEFLLNQNNDKNTQIEFSKVTATWAQEYIGADLIKDEISTTQLALVPKIAILDDIFNGLPGYPINMGEDFEHGANAANLTYSDSIVSSGAVGKIDHLISMLNSEAGYEQAYETFKKEGFPNVINNSMINWGDDKAQAPLKKIKDENVTIIASGGNSFPNPNLNFKQTLEKNFINVGWINDDGYYSSNSTDGDHIDLVAPAGLNQLSTIKKGTYTRFGGSSGAAPMVAGAATNIVAVLGLSNLEIIRNILMKSSMPFPLTNKSNGSGALNSYKAFKVAIRIKSKCHEDILCIQKEAMNDSNYQFEKADAGDTAPAVKNILTQIPSCKEGKSSIIQANNCSLANDMKVLRKAFFLTQDKEISSLLKCTYESLGFFKNASYYDLYSKNKILNYKDLESLSPVDYFRNIGYLPSVPKESILKKIAEFDANFNTDNIDNNDVFKIIYALKDLPNSESYIGPIIKIFNKYPFANFGSIELPNGTIQVQKGYDLNLDYLKYNYPINISLMKYLIKNQLINESQFTELKCFDYLKLNNQLSSDFPPQYANQVELGYCKN